MRLSKTSWRTSTLLAVPLVFAGLHAYGDEGSAYLDDKSAVATRLLLIERQLQELQQEQQWMRSVVHPNWRPEQKMELGVAVSPQAQRRRLWDRH